MCRDHHILLVVSSLSAGGAERVMTEMANWWAARDVKVTLLTFAGTDEDHYRLSPKVGRIALNFWGRVRTPWQAIDKRVDRFLRLRGSIARLHPDVVISFVDTTNTRTLTALLGTRIPAIISERIDPRFHDIGYFWSLSRRLLYPAAKALVVQTDPVARWAQSVVPAGKIRVISNFIRDLPQPAVQSNDDMGDRPSVLAIGRLDRQKGHDVLIRAFAMAEAAQAGWRLVILGEGPERSNLERLAADLGISNAVAMPGVVDEPAHWLYNARFFVLASRYEGFPNALLEAMACGCAVIATDCPSGPADIIRNSVNGLLVPAEDVTALSNAMLTLMEDEALRQRLGAQALNVKTTFSQDAIMNQWETLINKVMNRGGKPD